MSEDAFADMRRKSHEELRARHGDEKYLNFCRGMLKLMLDRREEFIFALGQFPYDFEFRLMTDALRDAGVEEVREDKDPFAKMRKSHERLRRQIGEEQFRDHCVFFRNRMVEDRDRIIAHLGQTLYDLELRYLTAVSLGADPTNVAISTNNQESRHDLGPHPSPDGF